LVEQVARVKARPIDGNGSLALVPADGAIPAAVARRIPVEAELDDHDGVTVHVLLHVLDGRVNELEVYRDDSGPVLEPLAAEKFRLVAL
jgi:hypothetical protein